MTSSLAGANAINGYESLKSGDTLTVRIGSDSERYVLRTVPNGVRVTSVRTTEEMVALVTNGTVSAAVDDQTIFDYIATSDCYVGTVGNLFYPKGNSLFVQNDSPWANVISTVILDSKSFSRSLTLCLVKEQRYIHDLFEYYKELVASECAAQVAAALQSDLGVLGWKNFGGLLIIWGACAILALLIALVRFFVVRIGADRQMKKYIEQLQVKQSMGEVNPMDSIALDASKSAIRQTEYGHTHSPHALHMPIAASTQSLQRMPSVPVSPTRRTVKVDTSLQVNSPTLEYSNTLPPSPLIPNGPIRVGTNHIAGSVLVDDAHLLQPSQTHPSFVWSSDRPHSTFSSEDFASRMEQFIPVSTERKIEELETKLAAILEKLAPAQKL